MKNWYTCLRVAAMMAWCLPLGAQPEHSFFAIHCDPGFAQLFPRLRAMVQYATEREVPLTIELSPQWVEAILAHPARLDTVRAWQAWGHEIGAHHHGIYHCFWDSLTNYPLDTLWAVRNDTAWVPPACAPGAYQGTLDAFYANLDALAGDSLLLTWGSSDEHPEVDMYPYVPYRTDGSRYEPERAFSNPYSVTHGPYAAGDQTWGPYTTCQIDYFFIDNIGKVNAVKNLYLDTAFSNDYAVVGVVTHVFDFNDSPQYFYQWIDFISGKGCKTVRQILRQAECGMTTASPAAPARPLPLVVYPNPAAEVVHLAWSGPADIAICDLTGRVIFQRTHAVDQLSVQVSDWPAGIYVVEVRSKAARTMARILVQ